MAVSPTWAFCISLLLIYIFLCLFGDAWVNSVSGYMVGNRRRFLAIVHMELKMAAINILVYKELMEYFNPEENCSKMERRRIASVRSKASCALLFIIFLSHLMYFMYYAPPWLQWLLFDITTFGGGIWTNLLAFVLGFFLGNLVIKYCYGYSLFRSFVDILCKIPYVHALIFDRKCQIRFTVCVTLILSLIMYFTCDYIIIKERDIPIKNFSHTNGHMRVALVSDIHAGASVYREQVSKVVDRLLTLDVDAVFMVGDMVDAPVEMIEHRVDPFFLVANRFPTFFVTGNHEYYYGDYQKWLDLYRRNGMTVLQNNATQFHGVCIAGVNDISSGKQGVGHRQNVSVAVNGCTKGSSRILLAHNPATVKEIPAHDLQTIDIMLSGHTHAGQFYVVVPAVYWLLPYYYGLYNLPVGAGKLFVTAGTLYQGPNMKMVGMSEIWVLNLHKE